MRSVSILTSKFRKSKLWSHFELNLDNLSKYIKLYNYFGVSFTATSRRVGKIAHLSFSSIAYHQVNCPWKNEVLFKFHLGNIFKRKVSSYINGFVVKVSLLSLIFVWALKMFENLFIQNLFVLNLWFWPKNAVCLIKVLLNSLKLSDCLFACVINC